MGDVYTTNSNYYDLRKRDLIRKISLATGLSVLAISSFPMDKSNVALQFHKCL